MLPEQSKFAIGIEDTLDIAGKNRVSAMSLLIDELVSTGASRKNIPILASDLRYDYSLKVYLFPIKDNVLLKRIREPNGTDHGNCER